jgi:hypothetical protein
MKGILIDDNGDLMVRKKALVIGDCEMDVSERLIRAWQGEFKEAPLLGGNVDKLLNGAVSPFWRGEMIAQLRAQHIDVKYIDVTENGIELKIGN